MIVDHIRLCLRSGKGGDGSSACVRKSGHLVPDGGPGGKGGDVIIRTSPHLYDLNKFRHCRVFTAASGEDGGSRNKTGKQAEPLFLDIPPGTLVKDSENNCIADMLQHPQQFCAACGGRGGLGNFKRGYADAGEAGEEKEIILDYRIPNDVALLGCANAGRTSLFNILTGQGHKVADYPFTTLSCSWAVAVLGERRAVFLDTPPLKESAEIPEEECFLKHLLRSRIILLVSDDPLSCQKQTAAIKDKVVNFDPSFRNKKFFHLLNKIDTIDKDYNKKGWLPVSAKTGEGIDRLKQMIVAKLG